MPDTERERPPYIARAFESSWPSRWLRGGTWAREEIGDRSVAHIGSGGRSVTYVNAVR